MTRGGTSGGPAPTRDSGRAREYNIAAVHKLAPVAAYCGYSTVFRGEAQLSGRLRELCLIMRRVAAADEGIRRVEGRVVAEVGLYAAC